MKHIAFSKARIAVLGHFLVSLSKSIMVGQQDATNAKVTARGVSRRRLVILLIVNDVLHAEKFHQHDHGDHGIFGKDFAPYLVELAELAAASMAIRESEAEKKLKALINFWTINELINGDDAKTLQERAQEALTIAQGGTPLRKSNYFLPEYHGHFNDPWFDLPASYMLEEAIKNPEETIDRPFVRVKKLDKKPVPPHVRGLLDSFFENLDLEYNPIGDNLARDANKRNLALDRLGQIVKYSIETGKTTVAWNGYGWSPQLCRDMQSHGIPRAIISARNEVRTEKQRLLRRKLTYQFQELEHDRERERRRRSRSLISRDSRSWSRERSRSRSRPRHSPDRAGRRGSYDPDPPRELPASQERDLAESGSRWNQASPGNNPDPMPQPPFNMSSFPQNNGHFSGQLPMQPFPLPHPFQQGSFAAGIPPPPPNFTGPFPHPPPYMAAMPTNQYNNNSDQFGNGYGNISGNYNQYSGNFQGGRGGFRGGYQGRGNNRGGYGGSQRGYRGGRW